jgi:hypothetical protein
MEKKPSDPRDKPGVLKLANELRQLEYEDLVERVRNVNTVHTRSG